MGVGGGRCMGWRGRGMGRGGDGGPTRRCGLSRQGRRRRRRRLKLSSAGEGANRIRRAGRPAGTSPASCGPTAAHGRTPASRRLSTTLRGFPRAPPLRQWRRAPRRRRPFSNFRSEGAQDAGARADACHRAGAGQGFDVRLPVPRSKSQFKEPSAARAADPAVDCDSDAADPAVDCDSDAPRRRGASCGIVRHTRPENSYGGARRENRPGEPAGGHLAAACVMKDTELKKAIELVAVSLVLNW